jgi:CBS domain-containing protein
MSLQNLLEKQFISCSPKESVRQIAELMKEKQVGAVVIADGKKTLGIVTDRDIALRCVAEGADCSETTAEQIMTKGVETVSIDAGIFDVIQVMKKKQVRRVPVVDASGEAVGLLSFGDMFHLVAEEIGALVAPIAPENPKLVSKAA